MLQRWWSGINKKKNQIKEFSMSDHASTQSMRKVAMTSLAGTSIEWYDFFIYGTAAALVFPRAFFPEDMPPMVATWPSNLSVRYGPI